ncbi:hypothetical protein ACJMK2_004833 [Sinanodonta woodiana]|uniref:Mannosyl-oligosaccharide glucosidase n=1 Tax=Sinanodonta woodiana TaxID=1069815 RepID=A0ABD3VPH9_SINWO
MTRDQEVRRRNVKNSRIASDIKREKEHKQSKVPLAILLFGIGGLITLVCVVRYFQYRSYLREKVAIPVDAPKVLPKEAGTVEADPERFWGSYRPQLYFGLKTRSPASPLFGFMWLNQLTGQMPPPLRHWCDQGDGLLRYGWTKHDGVNFGIQEIEDNQFSLKTVFVKRQGGSHGGDWTARISAAPNDPNHPAVVSFMFYVALDGQGTLEPVLAKNGKYLTSVRGTSQELGSFELFFPKSKTDSSPRHSYLITYAPQIDKLKEVLLSGMKVDAWDKARTKIYFTLGGRLVPRDAPGPNYVVHQVTVQLPFEMEVIFESGSFKNRPDVLAGQVLTDLLSKHESNFDKKFTSVFDLESKGYKTNEIAFAKAALSNMIGGIGYFYGSSMVQSKYNKEPLDYWNASLYTAVPSRSFFPRGFLWDEGFHNLLISQWNVNISKDIISHWLDLMNIEGWIPREQILGAEALAKVPAEFVVQKNENANPPTLYLALLKIIEHYSNSNNEGSQSFLKAVFPRLKVWYDWYNTSQVGERPSTYRWRGRDAQTRRELNPKTLTSGLDDFPRASHPTDDEYHVDLRCWMALASKLMSDIAAIVGEDSGAYLATNKLLTDNSLLDELHWSEKKQQYSDFGLHTDKVRLERPKPPPNLQPGQRPPQTDPEQVRITLSEPEYRFVDSFGYVSLFPFLLKIIDHNSPKLYKILTDLKDPRLLWTDYGLRSLAKTAPLYNRYNTEHDPPYWRGAIWINMNYLALGALHHYSSTQGSYSEMAKSVYDELRINLVTNIFKEYKRTGFIWENYNDKTGEGKGCHPFTGWSALVVLIMAEKY